MRCVEVYLEVRSNATAIASTLTNIRDQTAITTQTVTQHLDDMEETIRDTFVDLKVDVLTLTLASMERTITTPFFSCGYGSGTNGVSNAYGWGVQWASAAGQPNSSDQCSSPNQHGHGAC